MGHAMAKHKHQPFPYERVNWTGHKGPGSTRKSLCPAVHSTAAEGNGCFFQTVIGNAAVAQLHERLGPGRGIIYYQIISLHFTSSHCMLLALHSFIPSWKMTGNINKSV